MKAITVRQPWAWLIMNANKNIENRRWKTSHRGGLYIHAAKGMTKQEYQFAKDFLKERKLKIEIPTPDDLQFGGIIGKCDVLDCVKRSTSPWFMGPVGFVLHDIESVDFVPCRGQLGIWELTSTLT